MQFPVQITFDNLEPSPALETVVREHAAKLERFFDHIMACHVTIDAPHRHQHQGKLYAVRIDLTVPGEKLVVRYAKPEDHAHENPRVAVRDAFDAARRELEDYARRRRLDVKTHEVPVHGRVVRLFAGDGYGFIETTDGQEIYFHRNSVAGGSFDALKVDQEVRLSIAEKESAQGPQATTVSPVGKHHVVGEGTVPAP